MSSSLTPGTMKIAILGFSREGRSLYKFLKKQPSYKKAEFFILDQNTKIKTPKEATPVLGKKYLNNIKEYDQVFRSPGVPYHLVKNHKNITSPTELFFKLCPAKIIGITGTKGKGTTATLIYKILKGCKKDAYLVGNIGKPAIDSLSKLKKSSWVVFELSSFQLQGIKQSPHIAVLLDIFPDHMEVHTSYREYVDAKKNIHRHQKLSDKVFLAKDLDLKKFKAFSPGDLKIPGEHNFKNAVMAYTVTKNLKCPEKKIIETITKFKGNEHRLEFIKQIKGVSFYNDSASTNPQTTIAAVKAFSEPKILIAGGYDKNLSYQPWGKVFPKANIKALILIGDNKQKIKKALVKKNLSIKTASSLKEAVQLAKKLAVQNDVVILSPGAASFDMFNGYDDRGQKFKNLI